MAQKKNYWYVLVMTEGGPVFVTSVDYSPKVAHWDKTEKPMEMGKYRAEDLALGLNLNGHLAFPVCTGVETDFQPYNYKNYHIEWVENEKEEEDND